MLRGILEHKIQRPFLWVFPVQSAENCHCVVFRDGTFYEAVKSKEQPVDWCCPTILKKSPPLCLLFKHSSTCFIFFQVLGLSCAAARRIQTVTLTWMWMGTTHLNTGNHSIVFERLWLRGSLELHLQLAFLQHCPGWWWIICVQLYWKWHRFPSSPVMWTRRDFQLLPLRSFWWCSTASDLVGELCWRHCRRSKLVFLYSIS